MAFILSRQSSESSTFHDSLNNFIINYWQHALNLSSELSINAKLNILVNYGENTNTKNKELEVTRQGRRKQWSFQNGAKAGVE